MVQKVLMPWHHMLPSQQWHSTNMDSPNLLVDVVINVLLALNHDVVSLVLWL